MNAEINIEERKPIWIALSEFYLDTELQESDFRHIAFTILESPYSLEEIKEINKYEVFPVLQHNLSDIAGEWAGFNEEWLINSIIEYLKNSTIIKKALTESTYWTFKWMQNDYWQSLENSYHQLKNNPDAYIAICRKLWKAGIEPFDFDSNTELVKKLEKITEDYKRQNKISDFYHHVQDGQYWINLWTAYYILQLFKPKATDKLFGLKDDAYIVDYCIKIIESNLSYLKNEKARKNGKEWLQTIKSDYNRIDVDKQ